MVFRCLADIIDIELCWLTWRIHVAGAQTFRRASHSHSAGKVAWKGPNCSARYLLGICTAVFFHFGPTSPPEECFKIPARTLYYSEIFLTGLEKLSFDLRPHYCNPSQRFSLSVGVFRLFAGSGDVDVAVLSSALVIIIQQ